MANFKELSFDSNSTFFRPKDGTNRIRIVSEPCEMWVSFNEDKTVLRYLNPALARKDVKAKPRWAMWVIDREDGKIKIAEFGISVCRKIQTLAKDQDYGFDTLPPYDIKIIKMGSGLDTEYDVTVSPKTDLTPEEQAEVIKLEKLSDFLKKDPKIINA